MYATPVETAPPAFSGTTAAGKPYTLRTQLITLHDDEVPSATDSATKSIQFLVPVDSNYEAGKTYRVSAKSFYQKDRRVACGTLVLF